MGNDIADVNNDGMTDILTLDMLPKNEEVIKTTAGEDAYEIYEFKIQYGYHYQVSRNTLQLNNGCDNNGNLMFSDIAPMAGVEATDWSWAPLLADFDNDGNKDLFVANGIVGRPNDLDYINFISHDSAQHYFADQKLIEQMPSGKVPNVFFRNNADLTFRDVSTSWIGNEASLSNGASYADLDNDGDLDLVVNNINEEAFVYRNDLSPDSSNFLKIKLEGEGANRFGVGAKVKVFAGKDILLFEQIPSRGWLSSVDYTMHVGLSSPSVDSIVIHWPDRKMQTVKPAKNKQTIIVKQSEAMPQHSHDSCNGEGRTLLSEQTNFQYKHKENRYTAFNVERLIPHMLSTEGPKISVGDVNGDKLDDFFVGGAGGQAGAIFIQDKNENFRRSRQRYIDEDSISEDVDAAFVDVDGNRTLDLVVVSGGQEYRISEKNLYPRLYLNDGHGNFTKPSKSLPPIAINASCVKPADVDRDGDADLFIGGRVVPGQYGIDPQSRLLINNGNGEFKDETSRFSNKNDGKLGMVTDAIWIDIDQNDRVDLVVVGEWMPITILIQNDAGIFEDKTDDYGLANTNGWWNTIAAHDFDKDGDIDFVAGNLGLNSKLRATAKEPVSIFIGDIDNNNSFDHILTYYNQGVRYPLLSRDQLVKQIPSLRRKFLRYDSYKNVKLEDIVDVSLQQKFVRKDVYTFASVHIKNEGNGKFLITNLPPEAQMFPIFSFCIDDINADGQSDVLTVGNLDAVQPDFGRYDAGHGLVLLADQKGDFLSLSPQNSGFIVKGQGRDIKPILTSKNQKRFLVSRNNDTMKLFKKAEN